MNWPWNFFDQVSHEIIKKENTEGDFYLLLSDISKKWSDFLDRELTVQEVILMMLDYHLIKLKNDPFNKELLIQTSCYVAYLSEISSRDAKSDFDNDKKKVHYKDQCLIGINKID